MATTPKFTVKAKEHGRACISWQDVVAGRRYHFWVERDGKTPEDVIHSNAIDPNVKTFGPGGHRNIDAGSKKWAPIVAAMMAEIEKGKLIWKAREQDKSDREAKQRADRAERAERIRVALLAYATERSGASMTSRHTNAKALAQNAPDDQLLELAAVFAAA